MKKLLLACTALVATAVAAPKADKTEMPKAHAEMAKHADKSKHAEHLDVVAYWHKADELFRKAGYGEDTPFGRHTKHNLHRVETMHKAFGKHTPTQETHAKKAGYKKGWMSKTKAK